jgi:hypothetical protein
MQTPWASVQTEVRRAGVVAAVAASPESVRHLAGVHFASQVMIRRRLVFVIVPAEGEPVLLVQAVLEGTARGGRTSPSALSTLTGPSSLRAAWAEGLDRGNLLVEVDFLPAVDEAASRNVAFGRADHDAGDLTNARDK